MQIKAVLFDMFDTLMLIQRNQEFYGAALKRMHKYLASEGVNVSFEVFEHAYIQARDTLYAKAEANLEEPHFNVRISDALKSLGYNHEVSSPIVAKATVEFCEEFAKFVHIDEHAKTVLSNLHGKYRLAIISNFAIPECVLKLLKSQGLDNYFDLVVVSGAVNKRKPSREIFENTLKTLGVSAAQTVFVGDTADADIGGAKTVGMKAVYIKRRLEPGLQSVCPDQVIESLADLPSAIERCKQ
jgi:HAD superfamily hydrolase (TIGR01549 family)